MRPLASVLLPLALLPLAVGCDQPETQAPTAHQSPQRVAITQAAANQDTTPMTADSATNQTRSASGHDVTPLTNAQKTPLIAKLTPAQVHVTQKAGTEPRFCGTLLDNKRDGAYHCIVCDLPLFASTNKFDSGTGWPSFYQAFDPKHITRTVDDSLGTIRTEISCARCNAHLGHVFPDGPPPTGERHCLNSEALAFVDTAPTPPGPTTETAYFAGGCFWGIEHYFQQGPGVINAQSGYMNGALANPDYRAVCTGDTGHAEAVRVTFDPSAVTYERLLQAFFDMHDPTQVNRQGPDYGTQYRSGIFTVNDEQATAAKAFIAKLNAASRFDRPIATEVEPAAEFHLAEDYHQNYIDKTGRACHIADPWTDR